jgi:hypothetical protein
MNGLKRHQNNREICLCQNGLSEYKLRKRGLDHESTRINVEGPCAAEQAKTKEAAQTQDGAR